MIKKQNTKEFAKSLRDIYLKLNKNYTCYTKKDPSDLKEIYLDKIFPYNISNEYLKDLEKLDNKKNNIQTLNFSSDFDFEKNNRKEKQIRYGQKKVIKEIKKESKNFDSKINIVSLGIGNGKTTQDYLENIKKDYTIIGIDLHNKYLEEAKKRIQKLVSYQFDLNNLTTKKLKIETNHADIVECVMTSHHIYNFKELIKESSRILKKNGLFVFLDLTDKTLPEAQMTFDKVHKHPEFHGMEYYRDYRFIKKIINNNFDIKNYERIGPGLLYLDARK